MNQSVAHQLCKHNPSPLSRQPLTFFLKATLTLFQPPQKGEMSTFGHSSHASLAEQHTFCRDLVAKDVFQQFLFTSVTATNSLRSGANAFPSTGMIGAKTFLGFSWAIPASDVRFAPKPGPRLFGPASGLAGWTLACMNTCGFLSAAAQPR